MVEISALHALMTVEMSSAWLSLSSRLQVPATMKGLEPHTCLSPERIPIENTVACRERKSARVLVVEMLLIN